MRQTTRIITVAGTKGKTSCVRALHYAINTVHDESVLGVDTHKIMLGDKALVAKSEYTNLFGIGTAVCPGKTLLALAGSQNPIAVLEASFSTYARGLGYYAHEVGIFTNVYDDHIKPGTDIDTREKLAAAKASYIFKHIASGGAAVYNADNALVVGQLHVLPHDRVIAKIACSLRPELVGDADFTTMVRDGSIVILDTKGTVQLSVDVTTMPWLFNGQHQPSLYNGMFVISALWWFYRDAAHQLEAALRSLRAYTPSADGVRMIVRTARNGAKVVIDFAHEGESMRQIANFARTLAPPNGKVFGVVRLDNARHDEHIESTARRFVSAYDKLFIYDLASDTNGEYGRKFSEVPSIIRRIAKENGIKAEIASGHIDALNRAYEQSSEDTSIVYIVRGPKNAYEIANETFHFKEELI